MGYDYEKMKEKDVNKERYNSFETVFGKSIPDGKKFVTNTVWEEDIIAELAKNPADLELVKSYINWIKGEMARLKEDKNFGPHYHLLFAKLSFLEHQEKEDYESMQEFAARLSPNWLVLVVRPPILNCGRPNPEERKKLEAWWRLAHNNHREATLDEWLENHPSSGFSMDFVCPKKWHEMKPTENRKVRFCEDCEKNVYYCDNIVEARELGAQGCCIGIDPGVKRNLPSKSEDGRFYDPGDLCGPLSFFGRPSKDRIEEEKQRLIPDRISAKRIMKKFELNMIGHNPNMREDYKDRTC